MNILIVGGMGFIGSWLTNELIRSKHKVFITDRMDKYSDYQPEKTIRDFRDDLTKKAFIGKGDFIKGCDMIFKYYKYDVVVNLAATPVERPFDDALSYQQLTNDIELTYAVTKACKKHDVGKLVYMSSLFAYGDHEFGATENQPLNPKTPYGISKAVGEYIITSNMDNFNIIRTTSVYGFGDLNNRVTQIIINKAMNKEKFWINTGAWLDFIYIKDLVKGMVKVIETGHIGESFHISGGKAFQLTDYVKEVQSQFDYELDYEVKEVFDRPKRGTLDNTKARVLLDWQPKYNLTKGVADYIKNYARKYGCA